MNISCGINYIDIGDYFIVQTRIFLLCLHWRKMLTKNFVKFHVVEIVVCSNINFFCKFVKNVVRKFCNPNRSNNLIDNVDVDV